MFSPHPRFDQLQWAFPDAPLLGKQVATAKNIWGWPKNSKHGKNDEHWGMAWHLGNKRGKGRMAFSAKRRRTSSRMEEECAQIRCNKAWPKKHFLIKASHLKLVVHPMPFVFARKLRDKFAWEF